MRDTICRYEKRHRLPHWRNIVDLPSCLANHRRLISLVVCVRIIQLFKATKTQLRYLVFLRLLGTATIALRDLVRSDCNSMQADVNLLDGNQRTTQVPEK